MYSFSFNSDLYHRLLEGKTLKEAQKLRNCGWIFTGSPRNFNLQLEARTLQHLYDFKHQKYPTEETAVIVKLFLKESRPFHYSV